jgi:hypothetical protein
MKENAGVIAEYGDEEIRAMQLRLQLVSPFYPILNACVCVCVCVKKGTESLLTAAYLLLPLMCVVEGKGRIR